MGKEENRRLKIILVVHSHEANYLKTAGWVPYRGTNDWLVWEDTIADKRVSYTQSQAIAIQKSRDRKLWIQQEDSYLKMKEPRKAPGILMENFRGHWGVKCDLDIKKTGS